MCKISIIIPNYNHAAFLDKRLESIFNQTFQDFEIILLDDCSTDDSVKILSQYAKYQKVSHFIINETNSGSPFKQWQKGIDLARGEYIWIAESDDVAHPKFLEKVIQHTYKSGLVYSQTYDINDNATKFHDRIHYTEEFQDNIWESSFDMNGVSFITDYLLVKNVIPNASAVIFKKELINEFSFSDELLQMKMCGDWLFWINICYQTNVYFVSEHLNYFRNHQYTSRIHNSIEKKKRRLIEESTLRTLMNNELNLKNKAKDLELLKKWFKYFKIDNIFSSDFESIRLKHQSWLYFYFIYFKIKFK